MSDKCSPGKPLKYLESPAGGSEWISEAMLRQRWRKCQSAVLLESIVKRKRGRVLTNTSIPLASSSCQLSAKHWYFFSALSGYTENNGLEPRKKLDSPSGTPFCVFALGGCWWLATNGVCVRVDYGSRTNVPTSSRLRCVDVRRYQIFWMKHLG